MRKFGTVLVVASVMALAVGFWMGTSRTRTLTIRYR